MIFLVLVEVLQAQAFVLYLLSSVLFLSAVTQMAFLFQRARAVALFARVVAGLLGELIRVDRVRRGLMPEAE